MNLKKAREKGELEKFIKEHESEQPKAASQRGALTKSTSMMPTNSVKHSPSGAERNDYGKGNRHRSAATPRRFGDAAGYQHKQLLSGVNYLVNPDYHTLNQRLDRNDRLLHAVLCSYAKHNCDCEAIGWDALTEILKDAICETIGDDAFCDWLDRMCPDDNTEVSDRRAHGNENTTGANGGSL